PAVLQHPPTGLARGAVVDRVLLVVDACDGRRALGARLAEPVVDPVRTLVAGAAQAQLEPALQLFVDRAGEPGDLPVGQLRGQREGGQLRTVQDLVRPGAADAGQRPLVAEKRVQPARVGAEDLAEAIGPDAEGLRTEMGDLLLRLVRSQKPDTG